MPYHKIWESIEEKCRGKHKIGTTLKGIGPCYSDKISRIGIRIADICSPEILEEKLSYILPFKINNMKGHGENCDLTVDGLVAEYTKLGQVLQKYVTDTSLLLESCTKENKKILFEGAQGTFLDIDHGNYPYVTSSNTSTSAASYGSGVSFKSIHNVLGVVKAYTTRVGEGPFPTELKDEVGERIGQIGHEFGTTTGRKRRCGWFDAVLIQHGNRINGLDSLALMKLDVLSGFDTIKICTGYAYNEETLSHFPNDKKILDGMKPVYEEVAGWTEKIDTCKKFDELPLTCQQYVLRLEELTGIPIKIVSVGPERTQTIFRS